MARALQIIQGQHDDIETCFARVSDPDADRRAALGDLIRQLASHVSIEHSIIYPAIVKSEIGGRDLRRRLKGDYRRLQRLLVRIERRKVDSPDLPQLVTALQTAFRRHVGRGNFWSGFEERLGTEDLEDLSNRLERAHDVMQSHPHPHLLSLGPLSRLTTRLAARFDRARDRTVTNLP